MLKEEYYSNEALYKKDWKLFRAKIPEWQEAYMERLNQEYIALLSGDSNASEKFWELYKRQRKDKDCVGVQISMRGKSGMISDILRFIYEDVISINDLDGFSDELKEIISDYLKERS